MNVKERAEDMTDDQVERIVNNIKWATITIIINIAVAGFTVVVSVGFLIHK